MDAEKEERFNGFDLSEFEDEDKAQALIQFLKLDGEKDTLTQDGDTFTVNARKVKEGDTPQQIEAQISDFKALLTPVQQRKIKAAIELGDLSDETRESVYKPISKAIEKKSATPEYQRLRAKSLHVVNVLYWLLDTKEKKPFATDFKRAFLGLPLKDNRETRERDDGEYRVLTDDEADDAAKDYLEGDDYGWKDAVANNRTESSLEEWNNEVINIDGRASLLAGYDGSEHSETVNGAEYYIYRTN
jgi:hypothetical protein